MISEVIYNILFSSRLYFIEGQRGACAYIVVVFATQILACSTRSPSDCLKIGNTRVTRGRQTLYDLTFCRGTSTIMAKINFGPCIFLP